MYDYPAIVDYIKLLKQISAKDDAMLQYLLDMTYEHCMEAAQQNPRLKLVA